MPGSSLALDELVGQGEFYPFGVALTREGRIPVFMAAGAAGGGERDGIRIALESANGEAVTCFLPYTVVMPGGTRDVRPGEPFAQRGARTIFVPPT